MNTKDYLPKISVVLVNWNGEQWLKTCLDSLHAQTVLPHEIIFVDNASTDDSIALVRNAYPDVRIIQNGENFGFAKGNNIGVMIATGTHVLLLNTDTRVDSTLVERLSHAWSAHPQAASIQPKIVSMDKTNVIDTCGSYWTSSTLLFHEGNRQRADAPQFNSAKQYFSNVGAAMCIRKDVINRIGLFDDDFWCYYEDTDFCHRAWLSGYECWYEPVATVYHAGSGTSQKFHGSFIEFHNVKNKMLSMLKNFEWTSLIPVLPTFIGIHMVLSIILLLQGRPSHSGAIYRALAWNAKNLPNTLRKRAHVQQLRTRTDADVFRAVKRNPKIVYYIKLYNSFRTGTTLS